MERLLRPERLETDPSSSTADKEWLHWIRTFRNFTLAVQKINPSVDKLNLLINYVAPRVYDYIADCTTYETAESTLQALYVKPKNEIFARHVLATRHQESHETLDQFLQALKFLAKDCNFNAVTAKEASDQYIRDAFINGLSSNATRQRLLENKTLDLRTAYDQAHNLEMAEKHSASYSQYETVTASAVERRSDHVGLGDRRAVELEGSTEDLGEISAAVSRKDSKCYFCGYGKHPRYKCPARDAVCNNCKKKGHYAKVCRQGKQNTISHSHSAATLATVLGGVSPLCLQKSLCSSKINGISVQALIDTGSSDNFVSQAVVEKLNLLTDPEKGNVSMADTSFSSKILGSCTVKLELGDETYHDVKLKILPSLCSDIVLGHQLLQHHSCLEMQFGGERPPLKVCGLAAVQVSPSSLFSNMSPNCKPVAIKSRRYSRPDREFIANETCRMLKEGIIRPSNSPWRAQVLVTGGTNHKKRLVIDYSQTVNRFTELDAYPLPNMNEMVKEVATYKVFSTLDLKSAYHQVPLREEEKLYTAFEADGKLYEFNRIPFGVKNGVAGFQRVMDDIINKEGVKGTFVYVDNVTVCGMTEQEHDENLEHLLSVARKFDLTLNEQKCEYKSRSINLLGYSIKEGEIRPDPERLKPLLQLPLPKNTASLRRTMGMFAHYAHWIPGFSEKVRPLTQAKEFPLTEIEKSAFEELKKEIANSVVQAVDPQATFTVETDASDHAIAAALNQNGRPVAFFTRTLSPSEQKHSAVEKEAYAIVESLRKWRHYLVGQHFKLITDQRSVSFMFNPRTSSKIKNEKIARWRAELSCYHYDIEYRAGKENITADALSRVCGATVGVGLKELHEKLCHPGVARMTHFIRGRNLPYSVEEVRRVIKECATCSELKPRFHKPGHNQLIKATQPFERLNLDFKGPLPSCSKNKYMLVIVDEYSRFPFVFPCSDVSAETVMTCLTQLFSIFGMPNYIHSDRGASFMSAPVKNFLLQWGIASSRTTPYNPEGNGLVERYNGIIWKTIMLALKTKHLEVKHWEEVLTDALHSVRSLLCTSINCTPHERFFKHCRRSSSGSSLPTWLARGGPALLKRHVRRSKTDPLVDEVEVLQANPQYAHVRLQDGRETTVSLKHLAPKPDTVPNSEPDRSEQTGDLEITNESQTPEPSLGNDSNEPRGPSLETTPREVPAQGFPQSSEPSMSPRRSERTRRLPVRFQDYKL